MAGIFVLTIVLPFGAVNMLHARRLDAADADLRAIAGRLALGAALDRVDGAAVLIGAGDLPRTTDLRWTNGTSAPMSGLGVAADPDPWGNAYMVNVATSPDEAAWVLSAGPDGVIETPYSQRVDTAAVSGDDRAQRIR
jgi:hypothetical protein